jgi:hypothetical protein
MFTPQPNMSAMSRGDRAIRHLSGAGLIPPPTGPAGVDITPQIAPINAAGSFVSATSAPLPQVTSTSSQPQIFFIRDNAETHKDNDDTFGKNFFLLIIVLVICVALIYIALSRAAEERTMRTEKIVLERILSILREKLPMTSETVNLSP